MSQGNASSSTLKITFSQDPIVPHGLRDPDEVNAGEGAEVSIDEVAAILRSALGDSAVLAVEREHSGSPYVSVAPHQIHSVLRCLRDSPDLRANMLSVVSAVDYLDKKEDGSEQEPRIELLYVLFSLAFKTQVCVKIKLSRDEPKVMSVSNLFRSANWYERECYDMFGVQFEGHPNLERILLPSDWKGHPLRRDYVFPEDYNGMKVPL